MDRRTFLHRLGLASGGLIVACSGLSRRVEVLAQNGNSSALTAYGYGELVPAVTKNTGETYLALPRGFEYNVIGKVQSPMTDGNVTPRLHDGMAAFRVKNEQVGS